MKTTRFIPVLIACLLLLGGCARPVEDQAFRQDASSTSTSTLAVNKYLLPGNPKHPVAEDLSVVPESVPESERLDFDDVPQCAEYDILVRKSPDGLMVPTDVVRQAGYVSGVGEILGFTIYYEDGVVLTVNPIESESAIFEMLDSTIATNTAGVNRPFTKSVVRGRPAVARVSGRQAWSSGLENPYPSLITWDETSRQGIRVRYSLFSYERSPSGLVDVAARMDLLRMTPGDKTIYTPPTVGIPLTPPE